MLPFRGNIQNAMLDCMKKEIYLCKFSSNWMYISTGKLCLSKQFEWRYWYQINVAKYLFQRICCNFYIRSSDTPTLYTNIHWDIIRKKYSPLSSTSVPFEWKFVLHNFKKFYNWHILYPWRYAFEHLNICQENILTLLLYMNMELEVGTGISE